MSKKKQMDFSDVVDTEIKELIAPFRTPYVKFKRDDGIKFKGPGRTHQSFRDECNINNIMAKFESTGVLPEAIKSNPQYGDYASLPSYQESCHIVMKAEEQFSMLSAKVRGRFNNDAASFLAFCEDKNNLDEMYDLGLAIRPKVEASPPLSGEAKAETSVASKKPTTDV